MIATASPGSAPKETPRNTSSLSPAGDEKLFRRSVTESPKSDVQDPTVMIFALIVGRYIRADDFRATTLDFGLWTLDSLRIAKHFHRPDPRGRMSRVDSCYPAE